MTTPPVTASARTSRRSASLHAVISFLSFVIIIGLVNYLGFKYYIHKDYSAAQLYTLSPKTIDLLKRLDVPVTAYTFISDAHGLQIGSLLEEYQNKAGKHFKIEKIDPAYDSARASALQNRFHFNGKENLIILEYKGRNQFVKETDLYDVNPMTGQVGQFKGEQQITSALLALTEGKASKIYFTKNNGEHDFNSVDSPGGYGGIAEILKRENLQVAPLDLGTVSDVPSDASAVIIAGPTVGFSPFEADTLDRYLAANGKVFILVDPYVSLGLDALLAKHGMKLDNDIVLYRALASTGYQTIPLAPILSEGFAQHPITADFRATDNYMLQILQGRSITLLPDAKGAPNPKVQPLLKTDATAWGLPLGGATAPVPTLSSVKDLTFNKITDIAGPLTLAAVDDEGTTTDPKTEAAMPGARLVVLGASSFLTNDRLEPGGANFFVNAVDWLAKKNPVLNIEPKTPHEYGITLSPLQARTLTWTALIVIPGAALLMGFFTWLSRRK